MMTKKIISVVVVLIGAYLFLTNIGGAVPPVLSGVAFMLLGVRDWVKK